MQVSRFEINCPPWALPREEIPVRVQINKEVTPLLKNAKIDLPDCFELRDTINLANYEMDGRKIIVTSIEKAEKSSYDYFGVIIASIEPFTELRKQIPINIEFEFHNGTKESFTEHARIFRPLLEFEQIPTKIELSDADGNSTKIPIGLKFTGFGEIQLRVECKIEGEIVSVGTSILDEVLHRILSEGLIVADKKHKSGVTVAPNYVEGIVRQLKDKVQTDEDIQQMIREQQIDKEKAELLYEFTHEEKEKIMNIFFKTVEGYLIQIISDILNRNLSNNLQIESQTKISTQIQLPTTNVTISFFYKDIIGNEYEPIEKVIKILDNREHPSEFNVEIPLEIAKVDESEAYKNVGDMRIGTHS